MPSNKRYFIGIDGGGTKTELVLGDETGKVILSKTGESTNLKSRSESKVRDTVHQLLQSIPGSIAHIFVAAAGGDRSQDKQRWEQWIREIIGEDPEVTVENDAIAALAGTTFTKEGSVLIAGTGSILYTFQPGKKPSRTGGWGYLFGDEGSGFDIGCHGLQAVMQAYDGRRRQTNLTGRFLERFGLVEPEQLITFIYEHDYPRLAIASLANEVIKAASEGDPAADEIVHNATTALLQLIAAQMEKREKLSPIVLAGGVFQSDYFTGRFIERSQARFQNGMEFLPAAMPPAVGAYGCALLDFGISVTDTTVISIKESYRKV